MDELAQLLNKIELADHSLQLSCSCKPNHVFAKLQSLANHCHSTGHPLPTPKELGIFTCPCRPSCSFNSQRALEQHQEDTGHGGNDESDPIYQYFQQYPKFDYNPRASYITEFQRLATKLGWKNGKLKHEKRNAFSAAVIDAFENDIDAFINNSGDFNVNSSGKRDLTMWQTICEILSLDPIPETITKCRKAIQTIFINLVDLHMAVRLQGSQVYMTSKESTRRAVATLPRFNSQRELALYCQKTGKFFPKDRAKENLLLKCLLRVVM